MNAAEFKQQIAVAAAKYFAEANFNLEERRGIEVRGRIEIDEETFVDIYYSAATGKTSYTLIRQNKRIFGYDNSRSWHRHPKENPNEHIATNEPSPDQVFREINEIINLKFVI